MKVYPHVRNKYILTPLLFLTWMLFFDQNNIISQVQTHIKLSELRADKAFYEQEIAQSREDLRLLQNNAELLEKFAREKYLMKKENEEIFVFEVKEES